MFVALIVCFVVLFRSREELMMQALQSSQPSPTSYVRPPQQAPVISPPESKNSVPNIQSEEISASHYAQLQQKLAYVVAENAAYEDMFRVAENKLGRNAPIETLKTLDTRAHKPNIDSILSYPYADLLKLWREKVFLHILCVFKVLNVFVLFNEGPLLDFTWNTRCRRNTVTSKICRELEVSCSAMKIFSFLMIHLSVIGRRQRRIASPHHKL